MSTTLQYTVPNQETAPAISHYNFHRVHGAQIPVDNPWKAHRDPQCNSNKSSFYTFFGKSLFLLAVFIVFTVSGTKGQILAADAS